MKLSDLFLNRWLFKSNQGSETPGSSEVSATNGPVPSNFLSAGGNAAYDVNTNTLTVSGGKIRTGMIDSTNFAWTSPNTYATAGMRIDLDNGSILSKQFAIDSSGNASFAGAIVGGSINIPDTTTVASWHVDSTGRMWSGANASNFATAPFRVDASGNVTATSLTITGYIPTGGAAADVNANATTIAGGKITANSITASQIAANTITASQIAANTITATQIASSTITATELAANSVTAAKLTAGVFQVGGTSEPTAILVAAGSISGNSRISFNSTSGARIWGDSSNNIGINAVGGTTIFYNNSNASLTLYDGTGGTQSVFESNGLIVKGAFNVGASGSSVNARITGNLYFHSTIGNTTLGIVGGAGSDMTYSSNQYHYFNVGGSEELKISSVGLTTQGYFYSPNSTRIYLGPTYYVEVAGANKTAIVPTSEGFNALYCMESPEVWFMDFCTDKDSLDPLFTEVTSPPYHFIRCEGGEFQVWGKRKGHDKKRFENKTVEEFEANERFWKMNQPKNLKAK